MLIVPRLPQLYHQHLAVPSVVVTLDLFDFQRLQWLPDQSWQSVVVGRIFWTMMMWYGVMLDGDHETMKALRADAYDLVINGAEIGGGSIRIHDRALQQRNFDLLGFTREEAEEQFGFLMGAFEYGAPPHGGIAFGFDRLNAVMNGQSSIRDFIAFPKNTSGRDMMIDAPSRVDDSQLEELYLKKVAKEE